MYLPDELYVEIANYLDDSSVENLANTSIRLQNLLNSDMFYRVRMNKNIKYLMKTMYQDMYKNAYFRLKYILEQDANEYIEDFINIYPYIKKDMHCDGKYILDFVLFLSRNFDERLAELLIKRGFRYMSGFYLRFASNCVIKFIEEHKNILIDMDYGYEREIRE